MSSLIGFNIGGNPRGILNLGSTINSPLSGTLQAVTDGMGNASPLQLSTTDLSVTQGGINRLLISTDITMRRSDNTLFFQYSNTPDVLELNGNTIRLNTLRGSTAIGHSVAAARLHVRGDGTNPIARFENNAGTGGFVINSTGTSIGSINFINTGFFFNNYGYDFYTNIAPVANQSYLSIFGRTSSNTSGTTYGLDLGGLTTGSTGFIFGAGAGSGNFRPLNIAYTINNSGAQTGVATGIFLNATETALNGMTHNLMDLQVGGNSRFRVNSNGRVNISEHLFVTGFAEIGLGNYYGMANRFKITSPSDGVITFFNNNQTDFNRLQFGGTTNAFPALKRNGAALEVRLADDSAFAGLSASTLTLNSNLNMASGTAINVGAQLRIGASSVSILSDSAATINFSAGASGRSWAVSTNTSGAASATAFLYVDGVGTGVTMGGNTANDASALLDMRSTTQGFLLPRMTEAQRLAIAGGTPAIGLMVYQTDASDGLYVYKAGGWTLII